MTLNATVTAGVWVLFRGRQRLLLNPGQKFLRVETAYSSPEDAEEVVSFFAPAVTSGAIEKTATEDLHQWRISGDQLELIWSFVEQLQRPSAGDSVADDARHSRYFSGESREFALSALRAGRTHLPRS